MSASAGDNGDARSFEQLLEELEALTVRMSRGDIGIEEAADLYEAADRLHTLAADRLAQVQERIERLQPRLND